METLLGQKRLERIILINSSTFRYAEVQVDGNTHISGDNSSGKSTFLQIETLFYTGDSSTKALGIGEGRASCRRGQQGVRRRCCQGERL